MGLLRHAGFEAVHGCAARADLLRGELARLKPDLVLLVAAGVTDASALLDIVARAPAGAALDLPPPTLVILDQDTAERRLQALEGGAADVIVPPLPRAELVIRVSNVLRRQHELAEARDRAQLLDAQLSDRTEKLQQALDVLRTAERRLQEQLAVSQAESRGKSELMASAAHELRTPLHAIIGFADLIRTEAYGPLGDPRYVEYAEDIHQAAQQLVSLVDGTLDLAKAESGQDVVEIRSVDVGRVVQDSMRMLHHLAGAGGVHLRTVVPETPLMIRTDPEKVRQVVLNLASNAIKFTPAGGRVTVEVMADPVGGAVIMIVRDTGIGMSPQDIPTALKPFGQIRRIDRPHPKGTGLGLPLTRRFVEMLGGTMEISSAPGQGTAVRVRLPVDAPGDVPARPTHAFAG